MKLQSIELPIGRPQPRRKTPKLAPFIVLTFLFTIIPIYYPSLRYSQKKISSSSYDSLEDQIRPSAILLDEPCSIEDVETRPCTTGKTPPTPDDDENQEVLEPEPAIKSAKPINKRDLTTTTTDADDQDNKDSETTLRSSGSGRRKPEKQTRKRGSRRQRSTSVPKSPLPEKNERKVHSQSDHSILASKVSDRDQKCDLFSGEWVADAEAPYYTNRTCWAIQEHQNCMKFGRPDKGFMKWRWKPDGCELPVFDPYQFLELVRGKSLAFVGDSVARNHMQSLICLLSRVVYPVDASNTKDENFKRWEYRDYNFNISIFWAPYLVRTERTDPNDITRPFNLYLDEFEEEWTQKIERFDYVIISAGHWFFRPSMFYVDRRLVGCLYCPQPSVSHLTATFSYRRAFRTAFKAINSLKNYKGVTFLRTFAPSHFENGPWDKGGDCVRTRPFRRNETVLDDYNLEMYMIQLQELRIAQREGRRRGLKFRLFDATQAMLLRPDGHPSKYGHFPVKNVTLANDCVHWCLPGPIDTWNDFLLELLRREVEGRYFA